MARFVEIKTIAGPQVLVNLDRIACVNPGPNGNAVFVWADRTGRDNAVDAFEAEMTFEEAAVLCRLM